MKNNSTKYIVYCTTCTITKSIYIGVHMTDPNVYDYYIGDGVYTNKPSTYEHPKYKFQYAVKKYGVKNFIRNTIAIFNTEEEALLLEAELVNEDYLKRSDVYNTTLGGGFGAEFVLRIPVYQYSESGEFIAEYKSISEAARKINRSFTSVWEAIKNKCKCANFFWTKTKYNSLDLSKMQSYEGLNTIPTFQFDIDGNYECCYESIRDAARLLNISSANISNAIKLGTICNNKYFSNIFAPTFSISRNDKLKTTPIYQYDLEGNFIAEYSGMPEAKKKLGIKSDIYKAIKLGRTAGGYQWSFEKLNKIAKSKPKAGRARHIGKYDKDWNLLTEYKSLAECKKENGSGMVHVLTERDELAKGFRYKYLD